MKKILIILFVVGITSLAFASKMGIDLTLNVSTGAGAGGEPPSGIDYDGVWSVYTDAWSEYTNNWE